jgi:hypothetical protein
MNRPRLLLAVVLVLPFFVIGSASAVENLDPFCASCHTQPESEYFDRSLRLPSDLASAHTPEEVRCIDCHSGPGIAGRAGSLQQGASDLAAFIYGGYAAPAITTNPVGDGGCTKCHDQPSAVKDLSAPVEGISSSHYHFAEYTAEWTLREPDPRGSCVICHPGHTLGGLEGQAFSSNAAVQPACEACHAALSGWLPAIPG